VPARASFATGRHVHDVRCWDNAIAYDGTPASWGHRLMDAGHHVASIGKLHYTRADAHRDMDGLRDHDATRLCQAFEARGDVDAIPVDRAIGLLDDITQVHPDANTHSTINGNIRMTGFERRLDGQ